MTELKRWLDDSPPDAVARLLHSARRETAPSRVLQRTLVALGTTSAASAAAAASAGVASLAKGSSGVLGIVVKWGGAGLLGGSALVGAATGVERLGSFNARVTPAASVAQAASSVANPTPDLPRARLEAVPSSAVESDTAPPTAKPPARGGDRGEPVLAAEIELVDAARGHLRAGDGAAVLRLLAGYEQRFSPAHFAPEVLYLRMQSWVLRGDQAEARRLARLIVARYPKSSGVGQAEALLRGGDGAGEK